MKRFITCLLYGAGLLLLIYFGAHYQEELRVAAGRSFDPMPPVRFTAFYAMVFGAYLGLPGFATRLSKPGKVQFDWLRFLVIGIPAFGVCVSGALSFYLRVPDLVQFIFRIYAQFNALGTVLAGVAGGYILVSSVSKAEITDSDPPRRYPLAKIITLFITTAVVLYISLNGIIHPLKLVSVRADISDADGYTITAGETPPKQMNYVFAFANFSSNGFLSKAFAEDKIRIEPQEKLQQLMQGQVFMEKAGCGIDGSAGNLTTLTVGYRIGPLDKEGNPNRLETLPPEILEEIKNSLLNAELVLEVDHKERRYNLMGYREN